MINKSREDGVRKEKERRGLGEIDRKKMKRELEMKRERWRGRRSS